MSRRVVPFPRLIAVLAAACLLALLAPGTAAADHDPTAARIGGADRFDTAANVAEATYPTGFDVALLARADAYPDALAAATLAGVFAAPVLLTERDALPQRTRQALEAGEPRTVFLLGGEAAISAEVEDGLGEVYDVRRIAGPDRFATAALLARAAVERAGVGEHGAQRTAFLVSGIDFPDAVVAAAPAAAGLFPILLTAPEELPQPTVEALADLDIERVVVVGGPAAVSEAVVGAVQAQGIQTQRLSGATRTETAAEVADTFIRSGLLDGEPAVLARGDAFPDVLAAGPHAGALSTPLLLTAAPDALGAATRANLADPALPPREVVQAIGGSAAISPRVLSAAVEAARASHGDDRETQQTFVVTPQEEQRREPGDPAEFSVGARYDDRPFDDTVAIGLFPCDNVDLDGSEVTFSDEDGDQAADDIGDSDTGSAVIASVNGEIGGAGFVRAAEPGGDGVLRFTVAAAEADCAVAVVFLDAEPGGELNLDEQGRPGEDFGIGLARWTTDAEASQPDGGTS